MSEKSHERIQEVGDTRVFAQKSLGVRKIMNLRRVHLITRRRGETLIQETFGVAKNQKGLLVAVNFRRRNFVARFARIHTYILTRMHTHTRARSFSVRVSNYLDTRAAVSTAIK